MRGRRLWLKVEAPGRQIPVFVVKVLEDEDGHDLFGQFDTEKPQILIRQIDDVGAMKQTLHHELLHVCFSGHSGDARARVLHSKTKDGRFDREEEIVSFLEPTQYDLLFRNGYLRYPNPPRVK
jgi:hypothetical protein